MQNTRITDNTYDLGDQYGYDGAKRLVTVLRGVDTADIGTALATNLTNGDYDNEVVYTYDQTGNRTALEITPQGGSTTTTTYAHNTVNEMTAEDGATLTYDANGAYTDSSADSNGFAYNHADQLAEYDDGTDVWTFHFDGLGRRVQRDLDSTGRSVRFYYDGIHCIDQVNELANVENATKSFVYGSGVDELLEYVNRAPSPDAPYYVHADRLGSVMMLVDTSGAIEESYRYEEFGSTVILDGTFAEVTVSPHRSPVGNPYRYTGRRQDIMVQASLGQDDWYYSRARNLRTEVGRFLVRDPAAYTDGAALYAYAMGNPVSGKDPMGLTTVFSGVGSVSPPGRGGVGDIEIECDPECEGMLACELVVEILETILLPLLKPGQNSVDCLKIECVPDNEWVHEDGVGDSGKCGGFDPPRADGGCATISLNSTYYGEWDSWDPDVCDETKGGGRVPRCRVC